VFRRKVPPTKKRQKYTTAKNYHCLRLLDGSGASSYRQKEVFSGFSYARWCHQGRLGDTVLRALYQGDRGETAGQIESILAGISHSETSLDWFLFHVQLAIVFVISTKKAKAIQKTQGGYYG